MSLPNWEKNYNSLQNKVDKVEGKELSTNDFTDSYKNAIDNFEQGKEYFFRLYREVCADANQAVNIGYYKTNTETQNTPGGSTGMYGLLIVEGTRPQWSVSDLSSWIWQTFKDTSGNTYVRNAVNSNFSEWKKVY